MINWWAVIGAIFLMRPCLRVKNQTGLAQCRDNIQVQRLNFHHLLNKAIKAITLIEIKWRILYWIFNRKILAVTHGAQRVMPYKTEHARFEHL